MKWKGMKMKKISTKTHGLLDYGTALSMLALPRIFRWDSGVTRLLTGAAIITAIYSLFTRYELGVFKVLPMKAHQSLDALQSLSLASAPFLFANTSKSIAAWLLGISLFEGLVTFNTESQPRRRFLWFHL
jgi:hypothetical protein